MVEEITLLMVIAISQRATSASSGNGTYVS